MWVPVVGGIKWVANNETKLTRCRISPKWGPTRGLMCQKAVEIGGNEGIYFCFQKPGFPSFVIADTLGIKGETPQLYTTAVTTITYESERFYG